MKSEINCWNSVMPIAESTMMKLGTPAPGFSLPEPLTGTTRNLSQLQGENATLVIFMCNHCPFVIHILDGIVALASDYQAKGVATIGINANDAVKFPQDGPDKMAALAKSKGFTFPYLFDASQATAKAYGAACTPEFFLFDAELQCVYHGRMDDATPGNSNEVTGSELRAALDALLSGQPPVTDQRPGYGCSIKWKD